MQYFDPSAMFAWHELSSIVVHRLLLGGVVLVVVLATAVLAKITSKRKSGEGREHEALSVLDLLAASEVPVAALNLNYRSLKYGDGVSDLLLCDRVSGGEEGRSKMKGRPPSRRPLYKSSKRCSESVATTARGSCVM